MTAFVDVDTLRKDNALTSDILSIGQVIRIRLKDGQTIEVLECIGNDYVIPKDNYIEYKDTKDDKAYYVTMKWDYTDEAFSDYQKEAILVFIHEDEKLHLVELQK